MAQFPPWEVFTMAYIRQSSPLNSWFQFPFWIPDKILWLQETWEFIWFNNPSVREIGAGSQVGALCRNFRDNLLIFKSVSLPFSYLSHKAAIGRITCPRNCASHGWQGLPTTIFTPESQSSTDTATGQSDLGSSSASTNSVTHRCVMMKLTGICCANFWVTPRLALLLLL